MQHLRSERHGEIVVAVSRHVPIVMRRLRLSRCTLCPKTFRLRFSLRKHMSSRHGATDFALEDHEKALCGSCNFSDWSRDSVEEHAFREHPEKRSRYNCPKCKMEFGTKRAAELHRRSKAHRESSDSREEAKKREKKGQNPGIRCSHCGRDDFGQDGGMALRSHIESEHSSGMSVCGVCGQRFALPQDLGAHVRGGGCEGGRVSRKMGEDSVSRKIEEDRASRKMGKQSASRKMEIESISQKMGEESISRIILEKSTSRKIDEESASLKMEVSVKVEEGQEILGMACSEEGCGFEADTFNMLLFHQGWLSSYIALLSLI